jgi:hypothetical protein
MKSIMFVLHFIFSKKVFKSIIEELVSKNSRNFVIFGFPLAVVKMSGEFVGCVRSAPLSKTTGHGSYLSGD